MKAKAKMRVLSKTTEFQKYDRSSCVTIGVFDGVHLGHRSIISRCVREAQKRDSASVVLTFENSPRAIVKGQTPCFLTDRQKKLELLEDLGVEFTIVLKFDRKFASLEPENFCSQILKRDLNCVAVCVGENFHFGRGGKGNTDLLKKEGERNGFDVIVVPLLSSDGNIVSSTLVREMIMKGKTKEAANILGRPYSMIGKVIKGHARGKKLGFPTANIGLERHFCIPKDGVYAGITIRKGRRIPCAINVGTNPTFGDEELSVEVYLLDFDENIYGETLEVEFHSRLRDEISFLSERELIEQMEKDAKRAREMLMEEQA